MDSDTYIYTHIRIVVALAHQLTTQDIRCAKNMLTSCDFTLPDKRESTSPLEIAHSCDIKSRSVIQRNAAVMLIDAHSTLGIMNYMYQTSDLLLVEASSFPQCNMKC